MNTVVLEAREIRARENGGESGVRRGPRVVDVVGAVRVLLSRGKVRNRTACESGNVLAADGRRHEISFGARRGSFGEAELAMDGGSDGRFWNQESRRRGSLEMESETQSSGRLGE